MTSALLGACASDVAGPRPGDPLFDRASSEGAEASSAAHRDLNALRDTLRAVDAQFAAFGAANNLVESLVAPLSHDAIFLAPGQGFLRGPVQVRQFLESNPANLASRWRWSTIRVDVSSDGMHGYTYGYSEQVTPAGAILPGKYHAFWSRQADGTWRMAAFKRTPRTPGAVSLTPPSGFETPDNKHRRYFPNTDAAAERAALFAIDIAFSNDAQLDVADAFAKYAAPDGAQTGNAVIPWAFGPEAIRQAWAGIPSSFYWTPELGAAASSGDLGFTVGFVRSGNAIISKYFTIWQKQATGEWRFVVD